MNYPDPQKARGLAYQVEQQIDKLKELKKQLKSADEKYTTEWLEVFKKASKEARLSWCTWCNAVRDSDYLTEAWSLYSKSDDYGPVFAHTATKHRACSLCLERLASAKEAKKFDAMFEKDCTKNDAPSNPDTLKELCARLNISSPTWKEEEANAIA